MKNSKNTALSLAPASAEFAVRLARISSRVFGASSAPSATPYRSTSCIQGRLLRVESTSRGEKIDSHSVRFFSRAYICIGYRGESSK